MSRKIVEIGVFPSKIFTTEITIGGTNKEIAGKRSSIMGWSDWGTIADDSPKLAYKLLDKPESRSVPVDLRTALNLNRLDGKAELIYTGTYWMFEDQIKDTNYTIPFTDGDKNGNVISDLIEDGNINCILNYWEIPDEYLGAFIDPTNYNPEDNDITGVIDSIYNNLKADSIIYVPYSAGAQSVINNKARYGQSVTVKVYNPASGASLTKHIYDALPDNASPSASQFALEYRVAADIRPEGCPIFAFKYNDGGTNQLGNATEYIKGANWKKSTITGSGVNGSYFDKLALNNAREELNTRTALGIIGSAATLGVGLASGGITNMMMGAELAGTAGLMSNVPNEFKIGGAGLAATVGSYILSRQKLENQENLLNARSITAVAPIQIGNSDFIRDTGMNKFLYVFTSYNENDMYNFDTFLTRYGYNVGNMAINNRHFYSREHFNYVKVNDIQLISNAAGTDYYVGKSILEKVEQQLKQGVRIWRVKPDAHYLLPDGNNIRNEVAYRSGD